MRVCLLGKFPPIQGGVSAQHYWMARGLAEHDDVVHVVTNADEVEPGYRITLGPEDDTWLTCGGRLTVHSTQQVDRSYLHIPQTNPVVTKLTSLAFRAIEDHDLEIISAYYFEPYVVAGWLAASLTGRPLVVRHAGSDAGRLMSLDQLGPTYAAILRRADLVAAGPATLDRFRELGVPRENLYAAPGFLLPREHFRPAGDHLEALGPPDPSRPRIGVYGKLGARKGLLDLVAVLGELHREGLPFELVALCHGQPEQEQLFRDTVRDAGIGPDTRVLPFLPHWRIPAFLRSMTAICYLENRFPIAAHAPGIPREVLACGTALVTSAEVARKQSFAGQLLHGVNALVVDDPEDHAELAAAVRLVLRDPTGARRMGERGEWLLPAGGATALDHQRAMLEYALARREKAAADADVGLVEASHGIPSRRYFPLTRRQLGSEAVARADAAATSGDGPEQVLVAEEFAALLAAPDATEQARELFRWELLLTPRADEPGSAVELFHRLGPVGLAPPQVRLEPTAVPTVARNVTWRTFGYDMAELTAAVAEGRPVEAVASSGRHDYVFQRLPGRVRVVAVGELHRCVASCCDGVSTVDEVTAVVARELRGVEPAPRPDLVRAAITELVVQGVLTVAVASSAGVLSRSG